MTKTTNAFDVNSRASITAAVILGTIGVLSFIVQPGLAFGFVSTFGTTEEVANQLLATEGFGMASGALLFAIASRFLNWRHLVGIAIVAAALGNMFSALADSPNGAFRAARFLTGLGEGGIIVLSFAIISLTARIERNLGIYLSVLLTYGAIGLWLVPYALSAIGLKGVFWFWAILTGASFATVFYSPTTASVREAPSPTAIYVGPVMIAYAVFAILLYNAAIGVAWANLFFIGLEITSNEGAVANALLVSQFVAILGALLAIVAEKKISQWAAIISGVLVGAASLSILMGKQSYAIFLISVSVFNFAWNFLLPFLLSAIEDMRKGEMMTVTIATQIAGLTVAGPLIAAEIFARSGSIQVAIFTSVLLLILSVIIFVPAKIMHDRLLKAENSNL